MLNDSSSVHAGDKIINIKDDLSKLFALSIYARYGINKKDEVYPEQINVRLMEMDLR